MKREDDPQLWDLLDRGAPVEISPFFARNVLRQIRNESPASRLSWFYRWRERRLAIPAFAAVAVVIVSIFVLHGWSPPGDRPVAAVPEPQRIEPVAVEPAQQVQVQPVAFTDAERADINLLVANSDDDDDDSALVL